MKKSKTVEERVINPSSIKIPPNSKLKQQSPRCPGPSSKEDAVNQQIALTRFTGPKGSRLTKEFIRNDEGRIDKISSPNFSNGKAETVFLNDLREVEAIVDGLGTNECLAMGIFDVPECQIVTKSQFSQADEDPPVRTRSKEHLHQPECGLVLLDYDPDPYMPESLQCNAPDELVAKLVQAMPELEGVGYSAVGSSSNGIFDEKTSEPYRGGGGMHIYIAVQGVDVDVLQQFLKVRLWNDGFGYISFARNGAMLERTIVDLSVLSPERLIYEAGPVLGAGVGQKPREWVHVEGSIFTGGESC